MAQVRIWQEPGGAIKVTTLVAGDLEQEAGKLRDSGAISPGAVAVWDGEASLAPLPPSRVNRAKWRWNGARVAVDLTVPDPPHPRQALLDAAAQATTVAQLRAILVQVIQG